MVMLRVSAGVGDRIVSQVGVFSSRVSGHHLDNHKLIPHYKAYSCQLQTNN